MQSYLSLQRLAHLMIIIALTAYFLVIGQTLLSPIAFAILFSFLVNPILIFYERWMHKVIAILLTFLTILLPLLLVLSLIALQSVDIYRDLPEVGEKLSNGLDYVLTWLHERIPFFPESASQLSEEDARDLAAAPLRFITSGITSSTAFVANVFLTFIYTFLLLLYRHSLKNFVLVQFEPRQRDEARDVMRRIQRVVQGYINGLGLVMLILFVLNSTALWLIGIGYPFFWGGLAAFLAIIPYVGTFLGGILPFLYAIATTDTTWQPLAVAGAFMVIQAIEGNLITPNVVGSSMQVNPLVAILSLLVGASGWGVAGMILALPGVAVVKVVFSEISFLKPVSLLLSSHITDKEQEFLEKYDKKEYRIRTFFRGNSED